jgi:hypothetical protein
MLSKTSSHSIATYNNQPHKKMRSSASSKTLNFEKDSQSSKSTSSDNKSYETDIDQAVDEMSVDLNSDNLEDDTASENSENLKGFQKKLQTVINLTISDKINPISLKYYLKHIAHNATYNSDNKTQKFNFILTDLNAKKVLN